MLGTLAAAPSAKFAAVVVDAAVAELVAFVVDAIGCFAEHVHWPAFERVAAA